MRVVDGHQHHHQSAQNIYGGDTDTYRPRGWSGVDMSDTHGLRCQELSGRQGESPHAHTMRHNSTLSIQALKDSTPMVTSRLTEEEFPAAGNSYNIPPFDALRFL
jgi:hypothetical protein